jgi:hypothetical protein
MSNGIENMSCKDERETFPGAEVERTVSGARPTESASTRAGVEFLGGDHRIGQSLRHRFLPACAPPPQPVKAFPSQDSREPAAEVLDRGHVGGSEPHPRVLHGVVGLGLGAEHTVGDCP